MYHRQVSSRARSVPATMASRLGPPAGPVHDQVVDVGGDGQTGELGRVAGLHQRRQHAAVDPGGRLRGAARCRRRTGRRADSVGDDEGRAFETGGGRVAAQGHRVLAEPLADPGASAGPAEHGPAVVGVASSRRPVQVDHQVGDRARRQDRLVPAGRQLDAPRGPAQAPAQVAGQRLHVDVAEVAVGDAGPGRAGEVARSWR